jgi:hypothetical protein
MSLSVVIGVGIVVGLLMLLSSIVDKKKHQYLRNFLLVISPALLFISPASVSLDQTVCDTVVINETITGNVTTYEHGEHCFEKLNGSRAFIMSYGVILTLYMLYIGLLFFGDVLKWFKDVVRKN